MRTQQRVSEITDVSARLDGGAEPAGPLLLELAKRLADDGQYQESYRALRRLALVEPTFTAWSAAARLLARLRASELPARTQRVRVGLVGTSTVDQLGDLLGVAGLAADLDLEVVAAGFGQYETGLFDPSGPLHGAQCDVTVLAPDATAVHFPPFSSVPDELVDREVERWTSVWATLRTQSDAQVVQLGFVPPYERSGGSLEATRPGSRRQMFRALNQRLADASGAGVHFVDTEAVASAFGLARWWDDRYWFLAKQATSLAAVPFLAAEIASVMRGALGRARKCLVLDLDGTLWGGVVGDDGVEHIELEGTPRGEAHLALQDLLVDLRRTGVVLAVCSKNDERWARAPFEQRDDMRLSLDDVAVFVADWRPKSENLSLIAERLGLGMDSLVFLDDNPAERALVRAAFPEVDVIELPDDPSGYRRALADYRGFDTVTFTAEDAQRTEQYRARAAAADLRSSESTVEDFLEQLGMVATIEPVDSMTLPRVTQLVHKTNQWNLTTRRHPPTRLEQFIDDPDMLFVSLRLRDRFADHGIVAVVAAQVRGDVLDIDTFLMSCRVIGRQVEHTLVDHLVSIARSMGVRTIHGTYRPTPRNHLVRDAFEDLGFTRSTARDVSDDAVCWELPLDSLRAEPENRFIQIDARTTA